jgi:hypothetical protein
MYGLLIGDFFMAPPGAVAWTIGFATNFRLTKHPAQIQQWATGVLTRYENGKLATIPKAKYWAVGQERLADAEVPQHIRNLWWDEPSIGIATMTQGGWNINPTLTNITGLISEGVSTQRVHCVAFSWYLTGILVGPPDFKSTWNPWYIRQIIPGVYAYSGMK